MIAPALQHALMITSLATVSGGAGALIGFAVGNSRGEERGYHLACALTRVAYREHRRIQGSTETNNHRDLLPQTSLRDE